MLSKWSVLIPIYLFFCHYSLLLIHGYQSRCIIRNFSADKKLISVSKSVAEYRSIIPSLLLAHAPTGCDTVPMMFGIGKAKVINILKKLSLEYLGKIDAEEDDYMNEGK